MARNLYRFYLYIVYIVLLIFVAFSIGYLLNTLLAFTPLRGTNGGSVPDAKSVVQAVVLAIVAAVIAGALAGLHYWLIRRDIRSDPTAGTSAIRSFFLNLTEFGGIVLGVPVVGFLVLNALGSYPDTNVVPYAAFALPTLGLVLLLALERRRTQVGPGVALAFQRLHFYGMQILLLIFLTISWLIVIRPLVFSIFFANSGLIPACGRGDSYCIRYNPLFLVANLLWFVAFWIWYGWLVRNDKYALLRLILHCLELAYGIGFVLYGLYEVFQVLYLFIAQAAPSLSDVVKPVYARYDFFSPFTLGILIVGVYYVWLRMAARRGMIERRVLDLTVCAIVTILGAGLFWWGIGSVLYMALQAWMPVSNGPTVNDWATAVAAIPAGIGYVPLNLYLRRRSIIDPASGTGPYRGLVLALSGGGILALAIGGAVALYAWVTAAFGSPIANWQQVAHGGLAASIVGAILVAIYLSLALRGHLFAGSPKKVVPVTVASEPEPMIAQEKVELLEDILDELVAGKIARDEAAVRIRLLENGTAR